MCFHIFTLLAPNYTALNARDQFNTNYVSKRKKAERRVLFIVTARSTGAGDHAGAGHAAVLAVAHDRLSPDRRYDAYNLDGQGKLRSEQPRSAEALPPDALLHRDRRQRSQAPGPAGKRRDC